MLSPIKQYARSISLTWDKVEDHLDADLHLETEGRVNQMGGSECDMLREETYKQLDTEKQMSETSVKSKSTAGSSNQASLSLNE